MREGEIIPLPNPDRHVSSTPQELVVLTIHVSVFCAHDGAVMLSTAGVCNLFAADDRDPEAHRTTVSAMGGLTVQDISITDGDERDNVQRTIPIFLTQRRAFITFVGISQQEQVIRYSRPRGTKH